jgi:predicted RNA-binding Zn-ribbon protein involved in translation (DUF1610 family)
MAKEKIIGKHKISGNILECPVCGHNEFWTRRTLMNTPGLTFFGLEWANKTATNYVCNSCGHVLWFLPQN